MLKTTPECLRRYAQFCQETRLVDDGLHNRVNPYVLRVKGVIDWFLGEEENGALCYVNCGDARISMWPVPMAEEICVQFNARMRHHGIGVSFEPVAHAEAIDQVIELVHGLAAIAAAHPIRRSMTEELVAASDVIEEESREAPRFFSKWRGMACKRRGDPKIKSWGINSAILAQAFEEGWEQEYQFMKNGNN